MKSIVKGIAVVLLVGLIAIQFIRPAKNEATGESPDDIITRFSVPGEVKAILQVSCYDCHSNTTRYPWYAELQPAAWWLNDHIENGKKHLNFSEFGGYRLRRQAHKFEEIIDMVSADEMPLPSYTIVHRDAILSQEQKSLFLDWAKATHDSLNAMQSLDSLFQSGAK